LIKPFAAVALLLILMVIMMGSHYVVFPADKATNIMRQMTQLTYMAPLSLSVAYDESVYNSTYPEMQGLGRMDFIYER
jgi:phosphotransacetylase